jgi:hypothetical protein
MPPVTSSRTDWLLTRFFARLKFPWLFGLFLALFVVNLALPDPFPFIDELLLGMLALVLGSWKQRRSGQVIDTQATRRSAAPDVRR